MSDMLDPYEHEASDHVVEGSAREQARALIARRLCGWQMGHAHVHPEHFEKDAELFLADLERHGIVVSFPSLYPNLYP